MKASENYLGVIAPDEIERLHKSLKDRMRHPLIVLAKAEPPHQVATNTEQAARSILRENSDWLSKLKPRLLDVSDTTNASSALGEIRAYGALLETAMAVNTNPTVPGKKVVPEFEADAGDGAVIIEVHTRQLDPLQSQAIAENQKRHRDEHKLAVEEARAAGKEGAITSSAIGVIPFGAPDRKKKGDSVLTNVISRICNIKKNEKQIDPKKPFVLWLDLQDPTVWGGLSIAEQQLAPIYSESKHGEVGTGALWFALYGRKGDPMLEMQGCDYRCVSMLHDGRFALSHKISAVVYSLPRATVLMEHPSPALPLPPSFRASLLKTPFFRLDLSYCEWKVGLVKSRSDLDHDAVAATAKALLAFNPP